MATLAEIWGFPLVPGKSAQQALVQAHAQVLDLYRIHGLDASNPLTVAPEARGAGPVTQSIAEADGVVTIERAS